MVAGWKPDRVHRRQCEYGCATPGGAPEWYAGRTARDPGPGRRGTLSLPAWWQGSGVFARTFLFAGFLAARSHYQDDAPAHSSQKGLGRYANLRYHARRQADRVRPVARE